MARERILEDRCARFKKLLLDEWTADGLVIDEHLMYLVNEGRLTYNDARYLFGLVEDLDRNASSKDPPRGVTPKDLWDRKRQAELAAAMERYMRAGLRVPKDWIDEYNDLCTED